MGADLDQRMARERRRLLPVEEFARADAGHARRSGKRGDRVEQVGLGAGAKRPIDALEGGGFLGGVARGQAQRAFGQRQIDRVEPPDRLFEFEPPEPGRALDEAGAGEQGRGRLVAFEQRQREVAEIAVAVVEREHGEGRAVFAQSARDFGKARELEAPGKGAERGVEELGRDFEQAVGGVTGQDRREGAHAVKGQNDAASGIGERAVEAGRAERGEAGADECAFPGQAGPPPAVLRRFR